MNQIFSPSSSHFRETIVFVYGLPPPTVHQMPWSYGVTSIARLRTCVGSFSLPIFADLPSGLGVGEELVEDGEGASFALR